MSDSEDTPDGAETSFKAELAKIIEELSRAPTGVECSLLEEVKFLVAGVIGYAAKERITNFYDLFTELEQKGAISIDNTEYLSEVLHIIHRDSLADRLRRCPWKRYRRGESVSEFLKTRRQSSGSVLFFVGLLVICLEVILISLPSVYEHSFFLTHVTSRRSDSSIFFNVPPKYKQLYGQDVHLKKIGKCLESNKHCMLKGLQGKGKKCLLKTFAHDNRDGYPGGVFWLSSRTDIITMAGYIATKEGQMLSIQSLHQNYAYFEIAVRYARDYLSRQDKWLVIFADADALSDTDFGEMQRLVSELTSSRGAGQSRHVLYSAQVVPKHLPKRVRLYELSSGLTPDNAHRYLSDAIRYSSAISEAEKSELQKIWELAGCHPYAIAQAAKFIREWNFTLEAFLDHWRHTSVDEWLTVFGYEPEQEILQKQLDLLDELEGRQPEAVNMLLDYIRHGRQKQEIAGCRLHEKYKGVSLRAILQDLKNVSFVHVEMDTENMNCSFSIPAILRLVIEMALIQKGKLENWHHV